MSYILDALKKAEREREVGTVPSFGSVQDASGRESRTPWLWAVPLGVVVAGVIGALSWMQHRTPGPAPGAPPVVAMPVPQPASRSAVNAGNPAQTAQPTGAVMPTLRQKRLDNATVSPVVVRKEPLQRLDALILAPTPRPSVPVPAPATPAQPATVTQPSAPVTQASTPPTVQSVESWERADFDGLPLLYEMGPAFQSSAPQFRMDVHVYSDTPTRSFLIMNGRKYREGDDLGKGAVLVAITLEGAVVEYANERFRVLY